MIHVTNKISIDESEIQEDFIRSSGPGGQNVNKVSTAVQLRFNVKRSPSLPMDVKKRLIRLAGNRITSNGELIIDSRQHRRQERNRQEALNRLKQLIRQASQKPKKRINTKPTKASQARRLDSKKRHSQKKQLRGRVDY